MENDSTQDDTGKGRPTPKRADAEAARKQGLTIPKGAKAARIAARERDRAARVEARAKMMAGDPNYLPSRDRGPARLEARNFVDSRRTVGEFFVPVAIMVLMLGLIKSAAVQKAVVYGWSTALVMVILDTTLVAYQLRRHMNKKFPDASERPHITWYGSLRALQMRRFRIPPALVGPGGKPAKVKAPK